MYFSTAAREDAAAANRIAEALRSNGVEKWFDQSELRGGDAWDQKIRRQIDACALFMPIISRNTEERGKGYFRLEWKLAVEQTHLLLEGVPFIVPVVVDETPDSAAVDFPPSFAGSSGRGCRARLPSAAVRRAREEPPQGARETRCRGKGLPCPQEGKAHGLPCERRRPGMGARASSRASSSRRAPISRSPGNPSPRRPRPRRRSPRAPPHEAAARADDKSIAVLPFDNMSDEKENAFFTDGIQEDILTNLALVHEIRVVSRTSVEQYRDTRKPPKGRSQRSSASRMCSREACAARGTRCG